MPIDLDGPLISMRPRDFVNVEVFSERANFFKRYGFFTDLLPGTPEYQDFWREEQRRCLEGYEVGGLYITGYHYAYLNYTEMRMVDSDPREYKEGRDEVTGRRNRRSGSSKEVSFPRFWDSDYDYFHAIDIARYGVSNEEYEKLNLGIKIAEKYRNGGRHLIVLKARRKGYSYKAGSMMATHFHHYRDSQCYAMANGENHLIRGALLTKTWRITDFINLNTPFRQPFLIDQKMHRKAGYKEIVDGIQIERGRRNEIIGVTLEGDPEKARGKDGDLGFFEEAGNLPGLFKAWEVCKPSYEDGDRTTGIMIAFGTGGSKDADFEGLQKLFYGPEHNGCLVIENQWDEGAHNTFCGFFVPMSINMGSYMDSNGNSDIKGAREHILSKREEKREGKDKRGLDQLIAEQPLTPREATLQTTSNLFPAAELLEQFNRVTTNKLFNLDASGILVKDHTGTVKFSPDRDRNPILDFPLMDEQDDKGAIVIVEKPYLDATGRSPKGMYIVCHDPYAHDGKTASVSLGAAYVLKRPNNLSLTYHDCIVASWVGRPPTQDEYNDQLFYLAEYYNAKIDFENDRGEVIAYARREKKLGMLGEELKMLHKKELMSATTERPYGMHMTNPRKVQGEIYLKDWLNTKITRVEDKDIKILHMIRDPALLTELMRFNHDGNFDRVMALMVGMYSQKEHTHRQVVAANEHDSIDEFFSRPIYQD